MTTTTPPIVIEAEPPKNPDVPSVKKVRRAFSSPLASGVVTVLAVLWTIPVLGLLVTSLRPKGDVASTGWWTVFAHPHLTFANYNTVLFKGGFNVSDGLAPYIVNSLAITIPATIIPIILASMAAYVLAWVRFRGSDSIFFIIFGLQVVPLQMSLVPLLQLYSHGAHIGSTTVIPGLNLHGSLAQVWISHTMFSLPLAVFLLHNFISQLPESVIEAARVDGANHLRVYRSIVLPLSMPAIASFAIFQFLWVWNDLLVSLTFSTPSAATQPLTAQLQQLTGSFGSHLELLTAGAFVSIIIPMIVFFSLQRYFVKGMLAGSVKG